MIKIICLGKLKEKYLIDAKDEYLKRIGKYTKIEIIELNDSKIDDEKLSLKEEANSILKVLNDKDYVITLEIEGKEMDSVSFANLIDKTFISNPNITFIIGGSCGLDDEIKKRSNMKLSFSKLTFPHQLFRIMLLEQIYRSYKINNNERYHK